MIRVRVWGWSLACSVVTFIEVYKAVVRNYMRLCK